MPEPLRGNWPAATEKYGRFIYLAVDVANLNDLETQQVWLAILDLYLRERGIEPLSDIRREVSTWRESILAEVLPIPTLRYVERLLAKRRFVVLEGPPGTGKTRMALQLLAERFADNGSVRQFHPSTGYEQFIGGLAPVEDNGQFGFKPVAGMLMQAAAEAARSTPQPYLLVLDEVNRADLSRVLGEALLLFEPRRPGEAERKVELPFDFGEPWGRELLLPPNLHVVGTMNSADRSTAILDLAVRRRFAFAHLWPDRAAIGGAPELARIAFDKLLGIFVDEASDAALELMPGHAYFLAHSEDELRDRLRTELAPLLVSYLRQGLVPGIEYALDGYLQWLSAA